MQTSAVITNNIKEYSVVRLSRGNLKDLATLHSVVYSPVHEDHYLKKYTTAYTGVEYVGFIAYKDRTPIAYYGVIPCFIQCGTDTILAAQSADTMTHPGHRFNGMFTDLSNKTFELCKELGIRLVFGFPNQNSYHGAIKLGWKQTETMECFLIPIRTLPLKSFSKKNNFFRKLYCSYSNFILRKKRMDLHGVLNSVQKDSFAGVERNEEYLRHKRYSNTTVIGIGSAKLWISCKNDFMIGDMEGITEENFPPVIKELKAIAKKLGVKQIQFHTCAGTQLQKLFSSKYEATLSFPVLFQDFGSPLALEKIKFTFADIDIF